MAVLICLSGCFNACVAVLIAFLAVVIPAWPSFNAFVAVFNAFVALLNSGVVSCQ